MKIYHYERATGIYLGESIADKDPLDPDGWLIPAFATSEPPPSADENSEVLWDGIDWKVIPVPPAPEIYEQARSVESVRAAALLSVDATAEAQRLRWITSGSGQAMTYQVKAQEAAEYLMKMCAGATIDPASYPFLSAEVGISGASMAEVAGIVDAVHKRWALLASAIERVRLGVKVAISKAETITEIEALLGSIAWPEITEAA